MELEKLEDVQGLRFQHALILEVEPLEHGSAPDASESDSGGTLVVSKYNLLVKYGGKRMDFHNISRVIDQKRADKKSLVMQLELSDEIVCVESPTSTDADQQMTDRSLSSDRSSPRSSKEAGAAGLQSPNEVNDLLLIETVGAVHVYSLKNRGFLHTYDKPESAEGKLNRIWMRMTSWKATPVLLIVNSHGSLVITDLNAKKLTVEKKLGQSIRLASNVDARRLLIVSTANKVCLVTLEKGASRDWIVDLLELTLISSHEEVKQAVEGAYAVVGCRLDAGMLLLALLSPDCMDNMVLMCKLGSMISAGSSVSSLKSFFSRKSKSGLDSARSDVRSMELLVKAHCMNELFLLVDPPGDEQAEAAAGVFVGFKYIEAWDLYVVFSNRCTSTLLITANSKLLELNCAGPAEQQPPEAEALKSLAELDRLDYRVLLMSEGYALESNDFDVFVADVFVYPNYHNEIYRKFSLEDTPTLKQPVMVGLLMSTGALSFFYADRHVLDSENRELEVLCALYAGERDLYLIPAVAASPDDELAELFQPAAQAGAHAPAEAGAEQHQRALETILRVLKSDTRQDLVDLYYRTGRAHYQSDKRAFKLHEALSNSFDLFERSVDQLSHPHSSLATSARTIGTSTTTNNTSTRTNGTSTTTNTNNTTSKKLNEYLVVIKKLLGIQLSLQNEIARVGPGGSERPRGLSMSDIQTPESERAEQAPTAAELIARMHRLLDGLCVGRVASVSPAELPQVENSLLYVAEALGFLDSKFSLLECRLTDLHTQLLAKYVAAADLDIDPYLTPDGAIVNSSIANGTVSNGVTVNSSKTNGPDSTSALVESKLNQLVAVVVALHNRPLVDLGAAARAQFSASSASGPPKLRYNEYKTLFSSAPATALSSTLDRASSSDRAGLGTSSSAFSSVAAQSFGQVGSNTVAVQASSNTGVAQTTTPTGSNTGATLTAQNAVPTIVKPAETPSAAPTAVATSLVAPPSEAADTAGKVKFGVGTSILTGYGLGQAGPPGSTASQPTSGSLGADSNLAASSLSGGAQTGSVFASFSSNKSLLDIALNSSSTGGLFGGSSTLGGTPGSTQFPSTGLFGSSGLGGGSAGLAADTTSSGTFTGMGNFAANSFPTSSSMFANLAPATSGSSGLLAQTTGGLAGGLGVPTAVSSASQPPKLTTDLWGASRRSDPLD